MKLKKHWIMSMAVLCLAGCNRESDMSSPAPAKPVTGQDVKEQYKDALNTTKDYAVQNKDEFIAASEKKLKDLDTKMDELTAKAAGLKDDAKVQADKALATLKEQRTVLAKKLDELKNATADGWDKTKAAFTAAWADVEKAYADAKSKFI
jgi:uncharacterized protein (DUF3084 family)